MLCKKKDIIIQKLDQLLKKLGGEELSANITMGRVSKEWKEAMEVLYSSLVFNWFMNIPSSACKSNTYVHVCVCVCLYLCVSMSVYMYIYKHVHTYQSSMLIVEAGTELAIF
jgi:hypothetical protein